MTELLAPARAGDLQIEGAVQQVLRQHAQVPFERITASVSDGVATLSGTVDWRYQQNAAVAATRTVAGVRDIDNRLRVAFG